MIKTFTYETKTSDDTYHQTVYAVDIRTSVQKWIDKINDLKNEVYSFNATQVKNITDQFSAGQIIGQFDQKPFHISFSLSDTIQICYITEIDKGEPDFIAELSYLTTEEGGRKGYAASGYRPHVKFEGKTLLTSGEQLFIDKDKVFPGDKVNAEIRILSADAFANYLSPGQHFDVSEGAHLVARGRIIEIVNRKLIKASS